MDNNKPDENKTNEPVEQETLPEQPVMDFWGTESHRPDKPAAEAPAATQATTPTAENTPAETSVASAPTAEIPAAPAPQSSSSTLPSDSLPPREELLKPFETVEPPKPEEPADPPPVRKIASATFHHPDKPVDLSRNRSGESNDAVDIEPVITTESLPQMADSASSSAAPEETVEEETSSSSGPKNLWDGPALSKAPSQAGADLGSDGPAFKPAPAVETVEASPAEAPAPASEEPAAPVEAEAEPEYDLDSFTDEDGDVAITAEVFDSLGEDNPTENTPAPGEQAGVDFTLPPMEPGSLAGTNPATSLDGNSNLQLMIQEHQQWLDSQGAEGKRAVFREDNMSGVDLSHQRLAGASFRGLNLSRCKFTQAYLAEADFGDCNLEDADFTAAIMDSANFQEVKASNAAFTAAQIQQADFGGAILEHCNFVQAKMHEANFRDANLNGAKLQQSSANLANFRGAQMERVDLNHSDLTQAILREANLAHANFTGTEVVHANFKDADLNHVDLNSADFSQAQDISAEVQAQFMQAERARLHNEIQKLDHIRDELEQRERSLISEREELQRQMQMKQNSNPQPKHPLADSAALADKLQKSSRLFMFFGIGWFILCFILALILQNVFAQMGENELSLIEMMLMGVLMLGPLLFFVISMSKSFSISYALRKLTPHEPNDPY